MQIEGICNRSMACVFHHPSPDNNKAFLLERHFGDEYLGPGNDNPLTW